MKKSLLLSMLLCSLYSMGQISTQSNNNGSILITPKGLQGKSNSSTDTTNVALGSSALEFNTMGKYNTAIGHNSLRNNTTGEQNTATGVNALFLNTSGNYNTAYGYDALFSNTTGFQNTATGYSALRNNTKGYQNTANGLFALYYNTEGNFNTANGFFALYSNTTGSHNTATGYWPLYYNTTGYFNTAYGASALYFNKTGSNNTATGFQALWTNQSGEQNTANGAFTLQNNKTGGFNTASGYEALSSNTTGYYNTAYGYQAGYSNIAGNTNTFLGYKANSLVDSLVNATAIGSEAIVNISNKIRLGNTQVTVIEGQVAYSYPSDRRLKENILYTSRLGLDFITKLQTVSYSYKSDNTHVRHDGFIAQDIEQVMKELNVPFSGLKKSEDGMYSLAYSDFVMPLVNAAKELKQQNDEQQSEINDLKKQLAALAQRMTEMETSKTEAKMNDSEAAKR